MDQICNSSIIVARSEQYVQQLLEMISFSLFLHACPLEFGHSRLLLTALLTGSLTTQADPTLNGRSILVVRGLRKPREHPLCYVYDTTPLWAQASSLNALASPELPN